VNSATSLNRDTFFTFKYRSGYIHTCYNIVEQLHEVKYQIDDTHSTAKSIHQAKILITKYMNEHPYTFSHQINPTTYVLTVPRTRDLTNTEVEQVRYCLSVFSNLLPPNKISDNQYHIDAKNLADLISKARRIPSQPLPQYNDPTHNAVHTDVVSALTRDPEFFDDLSSSELITELAESHNCEYSIANAIVDETQSLFVHPRLHRIKRCIDLLNSLH